MHGLRGYRRDEFHCVPVDWCEPAQQGSLLEHFLHLIVMVNDPELKGF